MTDSLFLNLWFPRFLTEEMLPRAVAVMQQFPFSVTKPGITYLTLNPVSWNEPTILERRFDPGVPPEEAAAVAAELLHDDYAYVFEAWWDLWTLSETNATWKLEPVQVKFIVHGREFEEGIFEQDGHIQIDFGLDVPFLYENVALTPEAESRVRANVHKLVEFTQAAERKSGATGRLLWSESEENLAQKLIARLQRIQ